MILEVVRIKTKANFSEKFESGMARARALFDAAEGYQGMDIVRSIEYPDTYFCLVKWNSVEDHTEKFQKSASYQKLFELIGDSIDGGVDAMHCQFVSTN